MAPHDLMPHEIEQINKAINSFDLKNSGFLPTNRLGDLMRWLKMIPSEAEIETLTKILDPNGTGQIKRKLIVPAISEFWISVPQEFESKLWEAFLTFDKSDKGVLSEDLLRDILTKIGLEPLPEKEVKKIITDFQDPKTGTIEYGQLIRQWQE
ncbi:Calmodulin [Fasciolopsis buskii]|uniref:Calmodulin n=1 Tax=Fasciolopsis buskii TaxID=27845 RepID=A0A8E0S2K3_9TREM|nr:Calmodulin [Fasciolopsis buski]